MGQDPPGLRTLGEVAPENVYADRSFNYVSEVRAKEAEEWIRSSTPREFSRNFVGEESFYKAIIRLEEGLLAIESMDEDAAYQAQMSLLEELEKNFNLLIPSQELLSLAHWRDFPKGENLFDEITKLLRQLHLVGVVKYPSQDQKFISESNATIKIENLLYGLSNRLMVLSDKEDGFRFVIQPEEILDDFPEFSNYLTDLKLHLEEGGSFVEEGLVLSEVIDTSDDNASFSAQKFRNVLAEDFIKLAKRGLLLRRLIGQKRPLHKIEQ